MNFSISSFPSSPVQVCYAMQARGQVSIMRRCIVTRCRHSSSSSCVAIAPPPISKRWRSAGAAISRTVATTWPRSLAPHNSCPDSQPATPARLVSRSARRCRQRVLSCSCRCKWFARRGTTTTIDASTTLDRQHRWGQRRRQQFPPPRQQRAMTRPGYRMVSNLGKLYPAITSTCRRRTTLRMSYK